eukprot:TRINITY_DN29101_c0_g2_i2.p1 TRINITY_DN29101_c0_g2~~TRINITY_DN29101_c0_g2_i2.p1  ORF type:complete len:256 (-),score=64.86 TRINITY_DN29101_c0_g2_i2:111-878(-)
MAAGIAELLNVTLNKLLEPLGCYSCVDEDTRNAKGTLKLAPLDVSERNADNQSYCKPQNALSDPSMPRHGEPDSLWGMQPVMPAGTPSHRDFKQRVKLPPMPQYPCPPSCSSSDSEERRKQVLLDIFQDFVVDMHRGCSMTLLTSQHDYSEIHCWLSEDTRILKVDQGSGCIVEFPLSAVSTVQRLIRKANGDVPCEHVVIIEFDKRKLAFAFKELQQAQSFLICFKLLIYDAQLGAPAMRSGGLASAKPERMCY